ncbi:MAG: hypothetical protein KF754_04560 [Planctomycetes bacterium]|nr:hypothetical protein [Planctomycetota bacterium]
MRIAFHAAAAALLLVCLSVHSAAQDKPEDFPTKWNTWKTAEKGQWAEYKLAQGNVYKMEVLDVVDGKVKYQRQDFDKAGKPIADANGTPFAPKVFDKPWNQHRVTAAGKDAKWRDDTLKTCGVELKCRVASWTVGKQTDEVWYSTDVPCGGIVKQTSGGKKTLWVTGFKGKGKEGVATAEDKAGDAGDAATNDDDPKENPDNAGAKAALPKFLSKVGNYAIYKVNAPTGAMFQRHEVISVEGDTAKFTVATCDENGVVAEGAKPVTREQTAAKWAEEFKSPVEKAIKVSVKAGDYTCDKFERDQGGGKLTNWVSDGVVIKMHFKRDPVETTMELQSLHLK